MDAIDTLAADITFNPELSIKVSDQQGNTSDPVQERKLGEVKVIKNADIQFGASTLNINNALVKKGQEQTVARFALTNKNTDTFINQFNATFANQPAQVQVRVYEGNDVSKVVFDQSVTPTAAAVTINENSDTIKANTRYTVEVLASFNAAVDGSLSALTVKFDGGAAALPTNITSTVKVVDTIPEITVVKNVGADDILTFDVEANGDEALTLTLAQANISVAGFDVATWKDAIVLVDGNEVNAGVADKVIQVPANSKVRVTIQRGTMNLNGDATKGVLRLKDIKIRKNPDAEYVAGDKISSTNAANVVYTSSTDGTKVAGDWSKLRGEFSI